jgi:DNA adenine methylase
VVEHKSYDKLILQYDRTESFFFCDPPCFGTEKMYTAQFLQSNHENLCSILKNIKGDFLLTYNDCEYIRSLYNGFNIKEIERAGNPGTGKHKEIIDVQNETRPCLFIGRGGVSNSFAEIFLLHHGQNLLYLSVVFQVPLPSLLPVFSANLQRYACKFSHCIAVLPLYSCKFSAFRFPLFSPYFFLANAINSRIRLTAHKTTEISVSQSNRLINCAVFRNVKRTIATLKFFLTICSVCGIIRVGGGLRPLSYQSGKLFLIVAIIVTINAMISTIVLIFSSLSGFLFFFATPFSLPLSIYYKILLRVCQAFLQIFFIFYNFLYICTKIQTCFCAF